MCYIYVYLDTRKKGSYSYGDFHFEYEPFYVGKGIGDRYLSHLRIANGSRKGGNNLIISKIRSILNDGSEPTIIKIIEGLTKENYDIYEISTIKLIGKSCDGLGPLLNTTDGGDGGITWVGEHHNKGKKLEEIVGEEKAIELKQKLSEQASKRVGELNSNFGNRGELSKIYSENNPNFGKKRDQNTKDKISNTLKEYYSNLVYDTNRINKIKYSLSLLDVEEIRLRVEKRKNTIYNKPEEVKQEWYNKISKSLKDKSDNGELFSDEHRQKLKDTNYKKLNKGSDKLKLSDETKKKLSESLKNRVFTLEHRDKLRKCISFEEFEVIIVDLVNSSTIKTITAYRKYAKDNPDLKYPIRPEKSYKNCDWEGWRKYGL
jgi:regulator of RNase E activity RraB